MNIINPLVSEYLDELYVSKNETFAALRKYAEELHIPVITRDVERLIAVVLQGMKPRFVLEIGTAIGYSAAFMATTWPGCRVDTIELDQKSYETAMRNLTEMGLQNRVSVFQGDANDIMDHLATETKHEEFEGYDFVFVDASKSKYKSFFDKAMILTKPGGMILCDNVLMRGTVANDCYDPEGKHKTSVKNIRAFLTYISTLESVETAILPIGDGISMSIKKPI